jgi:flagellar biogenesis protein FliO
VAGAAVAALLLAMSDDPLRSGAGRAALLLLALAAAALLVGRRAVTGAQARSLEIAERHPLSRDAAVALLRVGGRSLLVGYGANGVRLLADLGTDDRAGSGDRP